MRTGVKMCLIVVKIMSESKGVRMIHPAENTLKSPLKSLFSFTKKLHTPLIMPPLSEFATE